MKNKEKYHLPISILLLVIFVGILVYSYALQRRAFWDSTVEQIATNVAKHEREIDLWFMQKMAIVDIISEDLHHFDLSETDELEYFLTKIKATNPGVMAAYIGFENKFAVFNDKQKAPPGFDPTIRIWYVLACKNGGRTVVSEPYTDIFTGKPVVAISKSVQLNNGINGVIGIDIDVESISNFINSIQPYYTETSFLLSANGNIIIHADTSLLPKKNEQASGAMAYSKHGKRKTSNANHVRTNNSNVSIKHIVSDGVEKYVAQIKISDVGWFYGCEIPVSNFNSDLQRIAIPLILILVIGFLISMSSIIFNWLHINVLERNKQMAETLSKTASIYLSYNEDKFEYAMEEGIKPGADLIGLDRVSIFRNTVSEDGLCASILYRWSRKFGVTQLDPAFEDFRYDDIAKEWKRTFTRGKSINGPVRTFSGSEADLLKSSGALSVFATPIFINESFWGFVLIEDHKKARYFNEYYTENMQSAALLCVNAILRAEMEREIKKIAHTDMLTGILNRARFMELTSKQIERIKRAGSNSYIVLFDLDFFKSINDTYGHLMGDKVLKCATERVNAAIRPYDIFGRYGGEEFILFVSDIDEANVRSHAERIRLAICETPMILDGITLTVSASFGVASAIAADNIKDVINLADKALYRAKNEGRNMVAM